MKIKYAVTTLVVGVAVAAQASLTITYTQNASGVTGVCTGTAPYTSDFAGNSGYADVGPGGYFGVGGGATEWVDVSAWYGDWSIDTPNLVDAPAWMDPDSASGTQFYFCPNSYGRAFNMGMGHTAGDSVTGTMFWADETLSSLGITETAGIETTFTPDDGELDPFTLTFVGEVIPEPATFAFVSIFGVAALAVRRIFMM